MTPVSLLLTLWSDARKYIYFQSCGLNNKAAVVSQLSLHTDTAIYSASINNSPHIPVNSPCQKHNWLLIDGARIETHTEI